MTKVKTRKAVAAKFKVTGTGKLMWKSPGSRHKLEKKNSVRKRHLAKDKVLDASYVKTYKRLMGLI